VTHEESNTKKKLEEDINYLTGWVANMEEELKSTKKFAKDALR